MLYLFGGKAIYGFRRFSFTHLSWILPSRLLLNWSLSGLLLSLLVDVHPRLCAQTYQNLQFSNERDSA